MEELKKNKDGRGGTRKGAGRPRMAQGESRLYSFRANGAIADAIDAHDDKSTFIKSGIALAMEREREMDANTKNNSGMGNNAISSLGEVVKVTEAGNLQLPYFDIRIVAGFPVPLDNDEHSQDIDILQMLCPRPEASYLIRVNGDSMIDADIFSGDILIVDRSRRDPSEKEVAVCELNGEYTVKHFVKRNGGAFLLPANPNYPEITINPEDNFSIWGTVTYVIHKPRL